jgi:hypothetical protein
MRARRKMHLVISVILIGGLLLTGLAGCASSSSNETAKAVALRSDMRKLWEDHVTWTRVVIIDVAGGLPATNSDVARLLKNQEDIGNAIKPIYGDAAGNQLTTLLKTHINGAADLLLAAKAGDKAKQDAASKAWYANADDIATFLSGANSKNWPLDVMKTQMKNHLDLTLTEAVARLTGDWAGDVVAYDNVHNHILMLADVLSDGIIKQFPDKFK